MRLHPADMQTRRRKKNISIFPYFSLFFLTDLILPDRADKNVNSKIILSPLRKCAYIRPIGKPGDKKKKFDFSLFFFISFNRLKGASLG